MRLDCWREATVSRRTTIDSHAIHATGTANINTIQIIFGFQYGNADSNFIESRVLLWSHQSSLLRGPGTPSPAARGCFQMNGPKASLQNCGTVSSRYRKCVTSGFADNRPRAPPR